MTTWDLRPPLSHEAPEYEHTAGPQVAALNEQLGFAQDPEQKLCLDDTFAIAGDGLAAAFEVGVVAPRQNLKTGVGKAAVLGWAFVTCEETITWSAHLYDTSRETFLDLAALIESNPLTRKRLGTGRSHGIHSQPGKESIELRDGRRILFKARTKTGARGLTGDKVVLDEAFALQPEHLGSIIPTLTAVPDPQVLYLSSPGTAKSAVLREIRDRGRARSAGIAWLEWGLDWDSLHCVDPDCRHFKPGHPLWKPGCLADREDLWPVANPLLGRQRGNGTGLTVAKMRRFRQAEPPDEFIRERLGRWDDPIMVEIDGVFGGASWSDCEGAPPPDDLPVGALGIAVENDFGRASIGAAAVEHLPIGDVVHVMPLKVRPGTRWVAQAAKDLQDETGAIVVLDPGSPAGYLLPALAETGVRVKDVDNRAVLDAWSAAYERVSAKLIRHAGYPELDLAVQNAAGKDLSSGRRVLDRLKSKGSSPLESVVMALGALVKPGTDVPPPDLPVMFESTVEPHELETIQW